MKRMVSKYSSNCAAGCGVRIKPGVMIDYDRRAPRGRRARHADCNDTAAVPDGTLAVEAVSVEFRTSGGVFYRNRNGVCEDAPCCGCCTF